MDIQQLETKLSRRPHSPLFVRLASECLAVGRIDDAGKLCRTGLLEFPTYATAHLMQAKYFAVKHDYISALANLQNALNAVPHSTSLQKLYSEWKGKIIQQPTFRHDTSSIAQGEISLSKDETIDVSPDTTQSALGASTISDVGQENILIVSEIAAEPLPATGQASSFVRHEEISRTQSSVFSPSLVIEEGRIVSKTLAEIYAIQGEYGEAILTYQLLKRQRPSQQQEFDHRIRELEEKVQTKAV